MTNSTQAKEGASKNVIVVGAGPVGLFIALRLAQSDISVKILEKEAALSDAPRAAGYYASPLLALDRAGLLEKAITIGCVTGGVCWRKPLADDGKGGKKYGDVVAQVVFPIRDPSTVVGRTPTLLLPQSKLAKLIYEEAIATGLVSVHFSTELTHIEDHGDSVTATSTRTDTGVQEMHQGSFLVGADGGRSKTRKLLNIPFRGHTWPERFLAVDCAFETPPNPEAAPPTTFIIDPVHFGVITPLEAYEEGKKSVYRCTGALSLDDPRSDEELGTEESAREVLEKMVPGPRPLDNVDVLRSRPYRIHQLCASTFRRGRCLLAGDAAHLNNPMGGMGLTTGILDGDAAADTLELILNEGRSIDLLDVYSAERIWVFQFFTNPVSTTNKLRLAVDPDQIGEDWLIRLLNENPAAMKEHGRHFFDTWPTNMRALADKMGAS